MRQFQSESRAIKRGHLKHVTEKVPEFMSGGVKDLYNVHLERRTNNGDWVFHRSKGQTIINTESKKEN